MATFEEKVLEEAISATPNYDIDYNDPRFGKVESDKGQALTELEKTYGGMINDTDQYFNAQIEASQNWADKQAQIQQEKTDFAIEQIEQQKEQANKDYIKEQSGAYVDWQKQSNQYGTEAEKMASAGLTNTGFSESSQVSMYNTYQMRVAMARESYNKAVLNYNNAIKDAQIQNNAALAEIAYQALQTQLELSLQGFQYKNSLILEQANKKTEVENIYYNRYQDVLQQINTENAIKEDIRQFTENQKWQTEQNELDRKQQKELADAELNYKKEKDSLDRLFEERQAQLDRDHDFALQKAKTAAEKELADHNHKLAMEKLAKEHANDKALLDYEYSKKQQQIKITGNRTSNPTGIRYKLETSPTVKNAVINSNLSSTNYPVNAKSKMTLGKGPISDAKAATMVNQGKANAYVKNGSVYVEPAKQNIVLPTQRLRK